MPHLRELVKLHKDAPFALIGVNDGDDEEAYRKGLEDHELTWLSAYQGAQPAISRLYQVTGFPTYVLIDADGTLVKRGHGAKEFDREIERLLSELARRPK